MKPIYKHIHNSFKLNDKHYNFSQLNEVAQNFINEDELFKQEIGVFLTQWLDDKDYIEVKTSGSTGTPKPIILKKQAMVNSAIATGDFFKLQPGNTALLCLPATYIAGKMMLVRAMVLGLELDYLQPTINPIFDTEKQYNFCAMIPAQVQNTINSLENIKTLIVGGAQVSTKLKQQFSGLKTKIFETYGMTETITHIAVKSVNNTLFQEENRHAELVEASIFKILPNITISQDERQCLVIDAPQLTSQQIVTNDVVKLHSKNAFEWLGRIDNVINSGGVKLFPEQIEAKLQSKIETRFFIASESNITFGEVAILIIEAKNNKLDLDVFSSLNSIETPKKIYSIPTFVETPSGKINRLKTLQLFKK
ncbi:AMP-binding protein [Olleya sp. R77988]|uniref:AMP-binding protein n=1 Tax=Olleya sp. R77988 TaxID=3093875 RepID=UPI0037CA037C